MSDDFLQWLSQKGVNFDIDFMNRAFDHNNYHFLDYCEKTYPNEFQHFIEYYDACTHIGGRVISSEQLEYLNTKRTLAVCVPTPCLHTEEVKPSETWSHWVKRVGTLGYVK